MVPSPDATPQPDIRTIPVLITSISHNQLRAIVHGEVVTRTTDDAMQLVQRTRTALATDAELAASGLLDLSDESAVERMATTALFRHLRDDQLIGLALDTVLIHNTLEEIVGLIEASCRLRGIVLDMEEAGDGD